MKTGISSLASPSKINIYLRILGRRPDGYHEIETIFIPLTHPSDLVSVEFLESEGLSVSGDSDLIPRDESNICWKAAMKYAKSANIAPSWKIGIKKNVPVAAGLGGGSANAATLLRILQNEYNALSEAEIRSVSAEIGADVPFFLNPSPSAATGIGEKLTPIRLSTSFDILLLNPKFPVSSSWAYTNIILNPDPHPSLNEMIRQLADANQVGVSKLLRNDLAAALYLKFPLLQILRDELCSEGAMSAEISGSGPSLFGLFASGDDADKAASFFSLKYGSALTVIRTHT